MRRLTNTLSFGLTFLFVLLLLGWYVTQSFDLTQYLDQSNLRLSGAQLKVTGPIRIKLFPKPGLTISALEITSETATAKLERLYFKLSLSQLFHGNVRFHDLLVDTLLLKADVTQPFAPTPLSLQQPNPFLQIQRIQCNHGTMVVRMAHHLLHADHLELRAEKINWQQHAFPLHLSAELTINSLEEPASKALFSTLLSYQGNLTLAADAWNQPVPFASIALNGQVNTKNTLFGKILIQSMSATLETRPNHILLNPVQISAYRGASYGDTNIDLEKQQILINQTGSNFNAATLFETPMQHLLDGTLDFSIHGLIDFAHEHQTESFIGNGLITLREGTIHSFNLDLILAYAKKQLTLLLNQTLPEDSPTLPALTRSMVLQGQTRFNQITLNYHIDHDLLTSNHFSFQNDQLTLQGSGTYRFPTELVTAYVSAHLETKDAQIQRVQQLLGDYFPLLIQGPLHTLNVTPDMPKLSPHIQTLIMNKVIQIPFQLIRQQLNQLFMLPDLTQQH